MSARDRFTASAPLALAITALALREATRPAPAVAAQRGSALEFVPPAAWVAAAGSPISDATFEVERASSRAAVSGERGATPCSVEGALAFDAAGELALDLTIAAQRPAALAELELHAHGADEIASAVAGVHVTQLAAIWSTDGATARGPLRVAWLRLPGERVRLHGVLELVAPARSAGIWSEGAPALSVGFDLLCAPLQR